MHLSFEQHAKELSELLPIVSKKHDELVKRWPIPTKEVRKEIASLANAVKGIEYTIRYFKTNS